MVMTARPAPIKCQERIDLPRPRDAAVTTTPDFMAIKRRLLAVVEEESLKTFAAAGPA